jgi:hypothetical protein
VENNCLSRGIYALPDDCEESAEEGDQTGADENNEDQERADGVALSHFESRLKQSIKLVESVNLK